MFTVQPVTARYAEVRSQLEGHNVLNPILVREEGVVVEGRSYFPSCDSCHTKLDCNSSSSSSGPSTGTAIIEALDTAGSTSELHVFGMNWMGGDHHFDFAQPDLVPTCCNKCTIHPTPTKKYDESRHFDFKNDFSNVLQKIIHPTESRRS